MPRLTAAYRWAAVYYLHLTGLLITGIVNLKGDVYQGEARFIHNTAYRNLLIGNGAGANLSGELAGVTNNVGIGYQVLQQCGSAKSIPGHQAGYDDASNSTIIGAYARTRSAILDNVTAVGYMATPTASNQMRFGNLSILSIGGYQDWTNFSDGRFKKNIKANVPGLASINALKPVTYTLDIDRIEVANQRKIIKAVSLASKGFVDINTAALSSGVYNYTLLINGNVVETKKLTVLR